LNRLADPEDRLPPLRSISLLRAANLNLDPGVDMSIRLRSAGAFDRVDPTPP
jgi:hypothetical protein